MGSHFVRLYSVDDARVRAAIGSNDRNALAAWVAAIRAQDGRVPAEDLAARERAAEQLVTGGIPPGKRDDGRHFGFAFLALCGAWADRQAVVECHVAEAFPALWALAARASRNPFGVPQCPYGYGAGHVGWHAPAAVSDLRQSFSAFRVSDPRLAQLGGTAENIAALDAVLANAKGAGRGVVVSWTV